MGFSHDEVVVVAVLAGFGVSLVGIIAWRIGQSIRAGRPAELPPVQQLAYHRERETARMSRLSSTVSSKISLVSPVDDDHDSFSSRPLSSASTATSRRSRGPPHRGQVQIVLPAPLYQQRSPNDHRRLSIVDSWTPLPNRSSTPRQPASRRASFSSPPPVPPIPSIYTVDNTQDSDRGRPNLAAPVPARQRRSRSATQARSQGAGIY